ncbi:MAG: 23S rRNA (adenine(2030)-N(6))-methyltransferase RlmJ [Hyphomicrobiaceae bacterium]
MNYRHAFHAGNFADVLKHAVLALALKRLTQKAKPLRVIDTHAGVGSYRLDAPQARRTGEWQGGIGRLIGPDAAPLPTAVEAVLSPYLDVVRSANTGGELRVYPGSPSLALTLLRTGDRLIANELHPEDAVLLREILRSDHRAKVLELDGWQAIRALLPPKERRGLVLIDPPFEEAGESERLVTGLRDGMRRFATGTYLIWLPIKHDRQIPSFERTLRQVAPAKVLWIELRVAPIAPDGPLTATALAVVNPPFGLIPDVTVLLPFLSDRLATEPGGGWDIREA